MSKVYRTLENAQMRDWGYRINDDGVVETAASESGTGFIHLPCLATYHEQCGHPNCQCPCHQQQAEQQAEQQETETMFEMTDDSQTLYHVTMREDEDMGGVYAPGTQWEFSRWVDGETPEQDGEIAVYDVVVQNWAITAFEQEMNSRSDVVSYEQVK